MEILFILLLCCILYTYFGYPLLLMVLTLGKKESVSGQDEKLPGVSLIISAHNEEAVIGNKILNSLAVDYPRELLEIIVVSDGSTDATPELVRKFADRGVVLVEIPEHVGKTTSQNRGVESSSGEIVIFSDANSMFEPDAVKALVASFTSENVGCVCGELRYRNSSSTSVGKSESIYWKYEQFCKKRESLLGSLVGVNGAIYSVRRDCFVVLCPEIISDFILPMEIYSRGREVRYCSRAAAYENTSQTYGDEFKRKKRIIVRSLYGLLRNARFLNPFSHGFFAVEIWSHKLIRWFVPFLLIGLMATNLLLIDYGIFRFIALVQAVFYLLALVGMVGGEKARSTSAVSIPYYFLIINLAAFKAILEFIMGERYRTWKPVRDRNVEDV